MKPDSPPPGPGSEWLRSAACERYRVSCHTAAPMATDPRRMPPTPEKAAPDEMATSPPRNISAPRQKTRTRMDEASICCLVASSRAPPSAVRGEPASVGLLDGWATGVGVGHDHDRGPVGHDFRHGCADLRRVEAHREDRVGAHQSRVLDHSVEGLAPGVLEQLGVLVDLATDERAEAGGEVAGEAATSDDQPKDLAFHLGDPVSGHVGSGYDDHWISSIGCVDATFGCLSAPHVSHGQPRRSASKV